MTDYWHPSSFPTYIEFFGLPGCGKTTLAKLMVRKHGHLDSHSVRWKQARFGFDSLKAVLLDYGAAESFTAYPELFSRVFEALRNVPTAGREREILLNYWRLRVSAYERTVNRGTGKSLVVDEGLVQTVFSTVMRVGAFPDTGANSFAPEELMAVLPQRRRILVLIDTPLAIANERQLKHRKSLHRFSTSEGQEKIYELYGLAHQSGILSVRVDGSGTLPVTLNQLSERLFETLSSSD